MIALRRRMLEDMQVRHLSGGTQQVYLQHISRFARYFGRSPAELGPEEIRAYQLYLTKEKQLTPSTLVIVVAALRFLYRVTLQKTWAIEAVIPAPKVVAPLSPVSRRADAARRRPGRQRSSPRDSGFVMTAHRSTSARAGVTAASTRVRSRVRVASITPARAVRPHPIVGSAHAPRVHRRATRPAHRMPPTIESP